MKEKAWGLIVAALFLGVFVWKGAYAENLPILDVGGSIAPGVADSGRGIFSTGGNGISATPEIAESVRLSTPSLGHAWGQIVNRPLVKMPLLAWSWRSWLEGEESGADDLPVRLIVGFSDTPISSNIQAVGADGLPAHSRAMIVVWGVQAGSEGRQDRIGSYARYFASSEKPDGAWWEQALDLLAMHRVLWPEVAPETVQIAFIAVAVRAGAVDARTDVMRIDLSSPAVSVP